MGLGGIPCVRHALGHWDWAPQWSWGQDRCWLGRTELQVRRVVPRCWNTPNLHFELEIGKEVDIGKLVVTLMVSQDSLPSSAWSHHLIASYSRSVRRVQSPVSIELCMGWLHNSSCPHPRVSPCMQRSKWYLLSFYQGIYLCYNRYTGIWSCLGWTAPP